MPGGFLENDVVEFFSERLPQNWFTNKSPDFYRNDINLPGETENQMCNTEEVQNTKHPTIPNIPKKTGKQKTMYI